MRGKAAIRMPEPIVLRKLMPDRVTIMVTALALDIFNGAEMSRVFPRASWLSSEDTCRSDGVSEATSNTRTVDSDNFVFPMFTARQ